MATLHNFAIPSTMASIGASGGDVPPGFYDFDSPGLVPGSGAGDGPTGNGFIHVVCQPDMSTIPADAYGFFGCLVHITAGISGDADTNFLNQVGGIPWSPVYTNGGSVHGATGSQGIGTPDRADFASSICGFEWEWDGTPAAFSFLNVTSFFFTGSYYTPSPVQLTISPDFGPTAGGTAVTITGTEFVATPTITFGGVPATSVVWVSDTELTCVTPAHALGDVAVVVTNPDGHDCTVPMVYTYTDTVPPPIQTAVATNSGTRSGPTAGGTVITITGSRFQPGCTVTIGGTPATDVVWLSSAMIRCTTPPHAVGAAAIIVTNPDTGVCTVPLDFVYTHRNVRIKLASSPPWQTVQQWALHRLDLTPTKQGPSGGNN